MEELNVDEIIHNIQNAIPISQDQIISLIKKSMDIILAESNLLELKSPIIFCGDIHGQLEVLFELFRVAGGEENNQFLFMGDYVDRGYYSIDTICYLLAWKIKTGRIYLLRGNHEDKNINSVYGFFDECQKHFFGNQIYEMFNMLFNCLPLAALTDGKVLNIHGGLSPELVYIRKINTIDRVCDIPKTGLMADITWSDPSDIENFKGYEKSFRGQGYIFGQDMVEKFVEDNNLDFITRSHQLVNEGIKWYYDNKLVNVWSAPNYGYVSNNKAAILKYGYTGPGSKEEIIFEAVPQERRRPAQTGTPPLYFS